VCQQTYTLAGVGLSVSADAATLRAVDARLSALRIAQLDPTTADVLRFDYQSGGQPSVERPNEALRQVYEPVEGEVGYAPSSDRLYLALSGGTRGICDPVEGVTRVWTPDPAPHLWHLSHAMLTLPLLEQFKRRGLYSLHAAGLSHAGRGLVIVGTSGAGKTTLALALARSQRFDFLSDDMLFLASTGGRPRVHAFPDEVDVTATTAGFFPELRDLVNTRRPDGWPKWSLRAEEVFRTQIAWSCEPVALVFPRIGDAQSSHLEPMPGSEALLEMLPNVLLTQPAACQLHIGVLARLAHETPCYRLTTGRDFDALPERLGALLG
jgi:hypothetical protein